MSKEVRTWAMLGGFMEIADTPGNEAPSRYTRYVRETDHKEVVDALLAERDALVKDAERYRWLRMADWWNSQLCVIRDPKQQAKLGTDCPSRDRLDEAIDAALQGEQP